MRVLFQQQKKVLPLVLLLNLNRDGKQHRLVVGNSKESKVLSLSSFSQFIKLKNQKKKKEEEDENKQYMVLHT